MKNAYLLIAHGNYDQLKRLIQQLDYKDNDIYIHINSLVAMPNEVKFKKLTKYSKVIFSERVSVVWGKYGILKAILVTLKCAILNGEYDYYHVITGADIPLKTNEEIEKFLCDNIYNNSSNKSQKTNYIYIDEFITYKTKARVIHYNLLVNHWKDKNNLSRKLAKGINEIGYYIQKLFKVNRLKDVNIIVCKGAPWWSITNDFAKFVIEHEEWCERYFGKYTFGADEHAIQMLFYNSSFQSSLFKTDKKILNSNVRLIDWKRGFPYIWCESDYDELINAYHLFARKFDENVDNNIINKLYDYLKEKE